VSVTVIARGPVAVGAAAAEVDEVEEGRAVARMAGDALGLNSPRAAMPMRTAARIRTTAARTRTARR